MTTLFVRSSVMIDSIERVPPTAIGSAFDIQMETGFVRFQGNHTRRSRRNERNRAPAGLDIEIVHRRSPDGEAEQLSINLQAAPSFEALGRVLEAANPFAF